MDPDELYCLPLDQFVPERDALAKSLRADGRREEAAGVAKLPKPSVAAWAVNQVVRAQPKQAAALWEAGDEVLDVQSRVVAGEADGRDLRAAIERQREALTPLAEAARGLVTGSAKFLGEAHVQAVVETLHAASVDPSAREDVAAARAARPLRLTGLEAMAAGPAARRKAPAREEPAARKSRDGGGAKTGAGNAARGGAKGGAGKTARPASDESAEQRRRIAAQRERDAEAEAERRAAEKQRAAREREARRALVRAERDRDAARTRVQKAVKARDDAAARVEAAETALARAEGARADAHAELEQAEDAVDRARAELDTIE